MDIRDQYNQASDKIDFFFYLTTEDKKQLYTELSSTEQSQLLASLPFQYLKNFIFSYPKQEQQNIYKRLSQTQLQAIYNNLNSDEKKEMMEALETRQIELANRLEESQTNIKNSTTSISASQQTITTAKENILGAKENLKTTKKELKQNKVILKKMEKERAKQLKKIMRSKKSLAKKSSRISIISKHRTNKYLKRLEELDRINQNLNTQKATIEDIKTNIANYRETIEKSNQQIEQAKQKIQEEMHNINTNVSRMNRTEIQIKKLNKTEKNILGRKLYHQQVYQRDTILVRNKHQRQEENSQTIEATPPVNEVNQVEQTEHNLSQNVETPTQTIEATEPVIERPEVEVITPTRDNTQEQLNHLMNRANALNQMGVNFYPPIPINSPQNASLTEEQITQLTNNQMVVMAYTMMAVWNLVYQQELAKLQAAQQTNQQTYGENIDYSGSRTRGSRGVVNMYLLLSLILFIFSLVLFFIQ